VRNTEIFHPGKKKLNTCDIYQHAREYLQTENMCLQIHNRDGFEEVWLTVDWCECVSRNIFCQVTWGACLQSYRAGYCILSTWLCCPLGQWKYNQCLTGGRWLLHNTGEQGNSCSVVLFEEKGCLEYW